MVQIIRQPNRFEVDYMSFHKKSPKKPLGSATKFVRFAEKQEIEKNTMPQQREQ